MRSDLMGSFDEKFLFFTLDCLTKSWLLNDVSIWMVSEDDTEEDEDMVLSGVFVFLESYSTLLASADCLINEYFSESLSIFLPNSKLLVSKYFRPKPFFPVMCNG